MSDSSRDSIAERVQHFIKWFSALEPEDQDVLMTMVHREKKVRDVVNPWVEWVWNRGVRCLNVWVCQLILSLEFQLQNPLLSAMPKWNGWIGKRLAAEKSLVCWG